MIQNLHITTSRFFARSYRRFEHSSYVHTFSTSLTSGMALSLEDCKLIKQAILLLDKENKTDKETVRVLAEVRNRLIAILNFV